MKKIIVVASTFPVSDTDSVPAFVKDQVIAIHQLDPNVEITVLAPHDSQSDTASYAKNHPHYTETRFHYAWPYRIEKLAGHGILPALQANPLNYFLVPCLFIGELLALFNLVRHQKPDIIYAHWFTPQAINARLVGSLTRTPFVFTTHASDVSVWNKIPVIGQAIVRSNVRRAQAFTAVSQRSMDKLAQFFSIDEWRTIQRRSKIIPMGVSIPSVKDTPETLSSNVLFVGRLAEKKGVHYLLPAFAELLKSHPDATLTIAGDGPWLERLKRQANQLNLPEDAIGFPGFVTGREKQELINSALVYVVPSIITDSGDGEGLPVSLMEGLAHGKICIATNESGADGILKHGYDGFLIKQKDTSSLETALRTALSLSHRAHHVMIKNARQTAQQFSWPHIAAEHVAFLFKDPR